MRITGGVHRSRELRAPKGHKTRPTADRVREALFSMLSARLSIEGARVLDLFAGTGALGLEALSRGAAHAVFVENAREALAALQENVRALGFAAASQVITQRAERAIPSLKGPFDIVFCDPPYALVREPELPRLLAEVGAVCAPSSTIVLEHDNKDAPPAVGGLVLIETRRYGDTALSFYELDRPT